MPSASVGNSQRIFCVVQAYEFGYYVENVSEENETAIIENKNVLSDNLWVLSENIEKGKHIC